MGRDRGFPCCNIVPLISCSNIEIMSRKSVAKAERHCVATQTLCRDTDIMSQQDSTKSAH